MPIRVGCRCGHVLKVPQDEAGRTARCPACSAVLYIPAPAPAPEPLRPGPAAQPRTPPPPIPPRPPALGRLSAFRRRLRTRPARMAIFGCLLATLVALSAWIGVARPWSREPALTARKAAEASAVPLPAAAPRPDPPALAPDPPDEIEIIDDPSADPPAVIREALPQNRPPVANLGAAPAPAPPGLLAPEQVAAKVEASIGLVQGLGGSGSGFLVRPGILATNAHVIRSEPPASIRVHFPSAPDREKGPVPVEVVYFDDRRDLAFLRLASELPPLEIAPVEPFRRGREVLIIGNPGLGGRLVLENAVSRGLLSTRVRLNGLEYFQLDASINPGNSGGPVLDFEGRVLGVATLRAASQEGLAFCIPTADLRDAVDRLQSLGADGERDAAGRHRAQAASRVLLPFPGLEGPPDGDEMPEKSEDDVFGPIHKAVVIRDIRHQAPADLTPRFGESRGNTVIRAGSAVQVRQVRVGPHEIKWMIATAQGRVIIVGSPFFNKHVQLQR